MGQNLSQKQSAMQTIVQFQNVLDELNAVQVNLTKESHGYALYKKYERQYSDQWNPLRFYNHFRLFYAIRRMEYSIEEMAQMQQQMREFDQLSYEYFKIYQQTTKSKLFPTKPSNISLEKQAPKQSK